MGLDDFDVPVVTQPRCRLAHQMGQHVDAERGIAGLQDGDVFGGVIDQPMVALFQPGGADHDRGAAGDGGIETGFQCVRAGEIDQRVARPGQRHGIVVLVDAARDVIARRRNRHRQRLAHAPRAADDADIRRQL